MSSHGSSHNGSFRFWGERILKSKSGIRGQKASRSDPDSNAYAPWTRFLTRKRPTHFSLHGGYKAFTFSVSPVGNCHAG